MYHILSCFGFDPPVVGSSPCVWCSLFGSFSGIVVVVLVTVPHRHFYWLQRGIFVSFFAVAALLFVPR